MLDFQGISETWNLEPKHSSEDARKFASTYTEETLRELELDDGEEIPWCVMIEADNHVCASRGPNFLGGADGPRKKSNSESAAVLAADKKRKKLVVTYRARLLSGEPVDLVARELLAAQSFPAVVLVSTELELRLCFEWLYSRELFEGGMPEYHFNQYVKFGFYSSEYASYY